MRTPVFVVLVVLLAAAPSLLPLAPVGRASPGDLVAQAVVPVVASLGVSITFDGTRFYYTNYQDPTLYSYTVDCAPPACASTLVGSVVVTFNGSPIGVNAIAYDAGRGVLWGADLSGRVLTIDPVTGVATFAFAPTARGCPGGHALVDGLAYDGLSDVLYYSPDVASTICRHAPDGALLGTIPISSLGMGCGSSGVAIGGSVLYLGSNGCGQIHAVDKDSLQSHGVFASPGGRDEGLTCDPVTFAPRSVIWSKDAFDNQVTAFEIEAGTCGVGGLAPCTSSVGVALADPAPGFDYVAGQKVPQSPPLAQPRVSGAVTLRADVTDASRVLHVDFLVDGVPVGRDAAAPYAVTWDTTAVPTGRHAVTARLTDVDQCPNAATQAVLVTCGEPIAFDVARPRAGHAYVDDAEHPAGPGPALVMGAVTLEAAASDPSRVTEVEWRVDGVPLGVATAPPYALAWNAAAAWPGVHVVEARAREADPRCVTTATADVRVAVLRTVGLARGVLVETAQPETLGVRSEGRTESGPGRTVLADAAIGDGRARLVTEDAENLAGGERAVATLADVELLGGAVKARLLRGAAEARFDAANFTLATSAAGSEVVGVEVNGVPVPVAAPNTAVTVPGVGRLVLDERVETRNGSHVELRVAALHLYVDVDGHRFEVVLGMAVAGADLEGKPFVGGLTDISPQSDAGTGRDVPGAFGAAHPLAPGKAGTPYGAVAVGGRVGGADEADAYRVHARLGDKLRAVVKPSSVLRAGAHPTGFPPTLAAMSLDDLRVGDLTLVLLDPAGQVAWRSELPLNAPDRAELNVDATGDWRVRIEGEGAATDYSLLVDVTPAPLVDPVPAPASCGAAGEPALDAPVLSSLRAGDASWFFGKRAERGDLLTLALVLPDADGQDFDLFLYDEDCTLLESSELGKPVVYEGDAPKGLTDAIAWAPERSGTYHVEVRRILGQGNFVLAADARSVLPTAPMNDALTGEDASDDPAAPTPLPLPAGAFEGRFDDGDTVDAYAFPVKGGERAVVTMLPSPINTATMELRRADGSRVPAHQSMDAFGRGTVTAALPADADATYVLVVRAGPTGGNYAFSVAHA